MEGLKNVFDLLKSRGFLAGLLGSLAVVFLVAFLVLFIQMTTAPFGTSKKDLVFEETRISEPIPLEALSYATPNFRLYGNGLVIFTRKTDDPLITHLYQVNLSFAETKMMVDYLINAKKFFELDHEYNLRGSREALPTILSLKLKESSKKVTVYDNPPPDVAHMMNALENYFHANERFYVPRKVFVQSVEAQAPEGDTRDYPGWSFKEQLSGLKDGFKEYKNSDAKKILELTDHRPFRYFKEGDKLYQVFVKYTYPEDQA